MNMRGFFMFVAAGAMLIGSILPGFAQDDAYVYSCAREAAQAGDRDAAFSYCHSLLHYGEASPYYQDALFAVGEYYFEHGDYGGSAAVLITLLNAYPQGKAMPFAALFLLRIDESAHRMMPSDDLKKKIITFKQLSLLFSEYKEYAYNSPLGNRYKAVYFIDKVEFYVDDQILAIVAY